jgi:hypothetical protein
MCQANSVPQNDKPMDPAAQQTMLTRTGAIPIRLTKQQKHKAPPNPNPLPVPTIPGVTTPMALRPQVRRRCSTTSRR